MIYHLASELATAEETFRFRWYRGAVLDAALALPGGRTLGVIRQRATAERTVFSDRFRRCWTLGGRAPRPAGPNARRGAVAAGPAAFARYPGPVFLTRERDMADAVAGDPVWDLTGGSALLSLKEVLERLRPGGSLLVEPPLA